MWEINPRYHVLETFPKKISHSKRLKCQKNTQIAELGMIHDKKESKNPGVVAAIVVLRLIILYYGRFYLRTGIYEEYLSPCWSSHREQSRRVIAHSLSSIGHEHEYGQRYYPGASNGGM